MVTYTSYTNKSNIPYPNLNLDNIPSYNDNIKLYSKEQQDFVNFMSPIWSTLLMTYHMPLFFKLFFIPIMFIKFKIFKQESRLWSSRITDPLYISLNKIKTIWNLSSLWIISLILSIKLSLKTIFSFNVKTEWNINPIEQQQIDNIPDNVKSYLYCSSKIKRNANILIEYPSIILHFHGGGFIACSPKGHEIYLRKWAKETNLPIVSVDYSLSPEYPFPTAFNQCTSVYNYLLSDKGKQYLGISYKNIIIVGDSAGGNMATAVTLWCITNNIQKPKGVVLIYPSLNRTPTLSTITGQYYKNDVVIPTSFRKLYTMAYISPVWNKETNKWDFNNDEKTKEYYITPLSAPKYLFNDFPQTYFICGNMDPLYYDTIQFYNTICNNSSNNVECDIIDNVTHGFLGVGNKMSKTSKFAITQTAKYLKLFSE